MGSRREKGKRGSKVEKEGRNERRGIKIYGWQQGARGMEKGREREMTGKGSKVRITRERGKGE